MSTRPLTAPSVGLAVGLALALSALAPGCADTEGCQKFAEHLADVIAKEQADTKISAESRDKLIKNTAETCVADKLPPEAVECGIKAETSEAIKACDKLLEAN